MRSLQGKPFQGNYGGEELCPWPRVRENLEVDFGDVFFFFSEGF